MQMPLKMARAIPDDPDGPVFQFSLIMPLPSRTQCMTHATINVNIVMQWKTQIDRVTPLLSRTPKRKSPVKAARIKMAMRYSGNGSFASPPIYCVPTSQYTRLDPGRSGKKSTHRCSRRCRNDTRSDSDEGSISISLSQPKQVWDELTHQRWLQHQQPKRKPWWSY